ncbi:transforming growth factor beta regulator 1 [Rhipicephalus microplus]|uniref:transforming growth factor beta regulator 1 n=1 Tax=Rhipicephalus microplus TaxID=6941 RepID=UPI002F2AF943
MTDDVSDDSSDLDSGVPAHTIKYFPRSGRQKGPSNLALKRANLMFTMENERYRTKCRKLERFMKDLVLESAALCDEVARVQESIFVAKEERRFLLKKLLQYRQQRDGPIETVRPAHASAPAQTRSSSPPTMATLGATLDSIDKPQAKSSKKVLKRRNTKEGLAEEVPRAKRRKPAGADKRLVAPIPLDSCGRPLFPIVLPGCKVHSLGEIVTDRAGFHCQESLYPVGYCSSRIYASVLNANHACIYTCTILDAGTGPRFEIVAEDAPERPFVGSSPDECYVALLRAVNRTCGAEVIVPAARGADFFALPHPTIQNLVQSCPGARKCPNYRWVRFEVSRSATDETERLDSDPYLSYAAFRQLCLQPRLAAIAAASEPSLPGGVTIKQEPLDTV